MMGSLCSMFHRSCKNELHQLIQSRLDDTQKIQRLESEIIHHLSRVKELQAIYDYQTFDLEQKIAKLEGELKVKRNGRITIDKSKISNGKSHPIKKGS